MHKLENKTKERCQVGNKAMKIKLANMLRGKERKTGQICKVKKRQTKRFIYIKDYKGKRTVGKAMEQMWKKIILGFKS